MGYSAPPELLEIFVDPETKGPLRLTSEAELTRLKQAIETGRAARKDGKASGTSFQAAFLAQEGAVAYIVEDDIPIFLIDERLEIDPPLELDPPAEPEEAEEEPPAEAAVEESPEPTEDEA